MSQYNQNPNTIGESPASGPAPTTAGHHKHDILNKLDPRIDSTQDKRPIIQQENNIPSGTYGPHSSRIANKLDPRVDSDLDGRGAGAMGTQRGMHGGVMGTNQAGYSGAGMTGAGAGMAGTGVGGMTNQGYGPRNVGARGEVREGTYGPHNSRMANAMDPRVDSDRDGGVMHGGAQQGGYQAGYPHDGRVRGGAGLGAQHHGAGGMVTGNNLPGPAPTTGGPHKSDLMNKLDPRVDSKTGLMKESGSGYSERRGI